MLPVINAPFRIYWAYNPLRLDTQAEAPVKVTREMFPAGRLATSHSSGQWEHKVIRYGNPGRRSVSQWRRHFSGGFFDIDRDVNRFATS